MAVTTGKGWRPLGVFRAPVTMYLVPNVVATTELTGQSCACCKSESRNSSQFSWLNPYRLKCPNFPRPLAKGAFLLDTPFMLRTKELIGPKKNPPIVLRSGGLWFLCFRTARALTLSPLLYRRMAFRPPLPGTARLRVRFLLGRVRWLRCSNGLLRVRKSGVRPQ